MPKKSGLLTACLLALTLLPGCQAFTTPVSGQAASTLQIASAPNLVETSLSREDYIRLTTQTIVDDLKNNDEGSFKTYLDWGKTQPEYWRGRALSVTPPLLQALSIKNPTGETRRQTNQDSDKRSLDCLPYCV